MNIESYLIQWINDQDIGVEAFADVPNDQESYGQTGRPESFITVERVGGTSQALFLDMPMVAIQCWAKSRLEASKLSYEVDKAVQSKIVDGKTVTSCQRNSLTNFPAEDGHARYQILYDLVVQG